MKWWQCRHPGRSSESIFDVWLCPQCSVRGLQQGSECAPWRDGGHSIDSMEGLIDTLDFLKVQGDGKARELGVFQRNN